jgi:hypothetical protein
MLGPHGILFSLTGTDSKKATCFYVKKLKFGPDTSKTAGQVELACVMYHIPGHTVMGGGTNVRNQHALFSEDSQINFPCYH